VTVNALRRVLPVLVTFQYRVMCVSAGSSKTTAAAVYGCKMCMMFDMRLQQSFMVCFAALFKSPA
jgi:hypothetical protein